MLNQAHLTHLTRWPSEPMGFVESEDVPKSRFVRVNSDSLAEYSVWIKLMTYWVKSSPFSRVRKSFSTIRRIWLSTYSLGLVEAIWQDDLHGWANSFELYQVIKSYLKGLLMGLAQDTSGSDVKLDLCQAHHWLDRSPFWVPSNCSEIRVSANPVMDRPLATNHMFVVLSDSFVSH